MQLDEIKSFLILSFICLVLFFRFRRHTLLARRLNLEYNWLKGDFYGEIRGFHIRIFPRSFGRGGKTYIISVLSHTDIGQIFTLKRSVLKPVLPISKGFTGDKKFDRLYTVKGTDRGKTLEILDEDIRNRLKGLSDSGNLEIKENSEYEYQGFQKTFFVEKSVPFAVKELLTVIEAIENRVKGVLQQK